MRRRVTLKHTLDTFTEAYEKGGSMYPSHTFGVRSIFEGKGGAKTHIRNLDTAITVFM